MVDSLGIVPLADMIGISSSILAAALGTAKTVLVGRRLPLPAARPLSGIVVADQ